MNGDSNNDSRWINLVRQQVEKTAFGFVQIVIHDSCVVRIERTEKLLLPEEERAKTNGN